MELDFLISEKCIKKVWLFNIWSIELQIYNCEYIVNKV